MITTEQLINHCLTYLIDMDEVVEFDENGELVVDEEVIKDYVKDYGLDEYEYEYDYEYDVF